MEELKELDLQYENYVGVDESGRGCVGGSMFFVACKLKENISVYDICFANDSKAVSAKKRLEMYKKIIQLVDYHVVKSTPEMIDAVGLSTCISGSLDEIKSLYKEKIIYDGNSNYNVQGIETLVKADAKISLVSAASIIAKHHKDVEAELLTELYPEFSFNKHKGYITKAHTNEIIDNGYCPFHRKSYNLKSLNGIELPKYKGR